jgi:hypothetical protein
LKARYESLWNDLHFLLAAIYLFIIVSILLSVINAYAQQEPSIISGKVIENELNEGLSGALVTLYDAHNHLMIDYTYTDDRGEFSILNRTSSSAFYLVASLSGKGNRSEIVTQKGSNSTVNPIKVHSKSSNSQGLGLDTILKVLTGMILAYIPKLIDYGLHVHLVRRKFRKLIASILDLKKICAAKSDMTESVATIEKETFDKYCRDLEHILDSEDFYKMRKKKAEEIANLSKRLTGEVVSKDAKEFGRMFRFPSNKEYKETWEIFDALEHAKNDL